jgi:predicted DNA-binding transcriptional regulator YafY
VPFASVFGSKDNVLPDVQPEKSSRTPPGLLRPGYTIPPLMFTPEEIEALVVGARWVIGRADGHLAMAARNGIQRYVAESAPG